MNVRGNYFFVKVFSIDEQFLDFTGSLKHFDCTLDELAIMIQKKVAASINVRIRVGIGPTKILAKADGEFC